MAILNFASTYEEVSDRLEIPESDSGEYVQLVFTKDGHIITHGVDYTPLFSIGNKGLVPGSNGKQTEFIRGNGRWLEITTSDLPIATSIADAISQNITNTTILNTQQIIDYVGNSFAANDAMVYKGTITYEDDKYYTHTTDGIKNEGFPTKCQVGHTYRVVSAATYAGQKCEVGDLLTCIKDGEGDSLNKAEYWTAIQTNINGQVKHTVNGTSIYTYSNSSNVFNIYAPTTGGTQNQVLISNGSSAPVWTNQSNIVAGNLTDAAKKALLTSVELSNNGIVSVSVGGTTLSSNLASGTWGINITGQANRVENDLSAGIGLYMGTENETYNGSDARTISLLRASNTQLGGVIVDKDSEKKTISVDSTGNIFLTSQNIINALGYVPGSSDTLIYKQVISDTSTSTSQIQQQIINPFINLVQIANSEETVTSTYQIIGSENVTVKGNENNIIISSSWRPITIGGVSIENKTLNFIPTGDIYIKADGNEDDIQDISFGLSWYNISTGQYEIA